MKKLISLFTVFLMICSFDFTAVADGDTATNYQAIRFSTAGDNVKRGLPHNSTGLQLSLEGTTDGENWVAINNNANVEYRSLFNIAKVSETGLVTRVFAENGNGVAPILAAYKNSDGSIVTTKTNVILHNTEDRVKFIKDFSTLTNFENFKAEDKYQLNGFNVLDIYKYYADSATDKNQPINSTTGANTIRDEDIMEFWFYDTLNSSNDINVRNGGTADTRDFSMHIGFGTEEYVITEDFDKEHPATLNNIKRTEGWHQVTVMLWGGSTNQVDAKQHVVAYIDGEVIFDKAVTDGTLGVDYMWYVSQYSSAEAGKTYISDCKYYSTRLNGLSLPVILDTEFKNFVYDKSDSIYKVLRNGANASDSNNVDFNSKNLATTNYVKAQAFYNYYMPGEVQNGGEMRIYDPNSGEQGGTGTTNNDTVYGGKVYTFMTINSANNLEFNVKVSSTSAGDNQMSEKISYSSETINTGHTAYRLSQPLLYGQDTTTGYYHDITNDGVIGYSKVKAGVRYMNHYDNEVDVMVSIAQYEDGKLIDVYTENTKFGTGTTRDIVQEFNVGDSTKTEFKTFIWRTASYNPDSSVYQYLLRPYEDKNNTTAEAYTFGPFGRK